MIRIASEDQLLETFRSTDQDQVHIPANFSFPLPVKDYVSWVEPSGHRVYLVFEDLVNSRPLGVVFQRTRGAPDTPASMCQWCHSVRSGGAVSLLTTDMGPNRRVGLHLCSNLNCKENALSAPGIHDFSEGVSGRERVQRILQRMNDFAKKNLF